MEDPTLQDYSTESLQDIKWGLGGIKGFLFSGGVFSSVVSVHEFRLTADSDNSNDLVFLTPLFLSIEDNSVRSEAMAAISKFQLPDL